MMAKKLIEKYPNSIETIYNKTIIALLMRDDVTLSKILSINSDESISSILRILSERLHSRND